jgi:hypothetical protein
MLGVAKIRRLLPVSRLPYENILEQALLDLTVTLSFDSLLTVSPVLVLLLDPTCFAQILVSSSNSNVSPARNGKSDSNILGRGFGYTFGQLLSYPRPLLVRKQEIPLRLLNNT